MRIQLVLEYSNDKETIIHSENIGKVHEVYGSIGLWLEVMYIDTGVSFWLIDGEWQTFWMKEIGRYKRYRAVNVG